MWLHDFGLPSRENTPVPALVLDEPCLEEDLVVPSTVIVILSNWLFFPMAVLAAPVKNMCLF